MRKIIFYFLIFTITSTVYGQSAVDSSDSSKKEYSPNPHTIKATLLSVALPGAGQIYNKKYWKVPIIYGGGALLGYFAYYSNKQYIGYRDALNYRQEIADDIESSLIDQYPQYDDSQLRVQKDYYRKNRDRSIIYLVLLYTLNIIDANVDAHFTDFPIIEEKMIMSFRPDVNSNYKGLSLTLSF